MPNYRWPRDYFFGTLTNSAAISDTSLVSADFAALSTSYTTDAVLPLTLHDPVLKVHEVVWVTTHALSSTTVTVQRAKEGTTARAWPASTQVICAPTQRDGVTLANRSGLPSDRHTGQRAVLLDEGISLESTFDQGWQASVGMAVPSEYGLRRDGTAIPLWKTILARGGRVTGTTDANGRITGTYAAPFPTETLRVNPVLVSTSLGTVGLSIDSVVTPTASQFTIYVYNTATGASAPGVNISIDYTATGY